VIEKIVESLISGLVVPILLELWRSHRQRTERTAAEPVRAEPAPRPTPRPYPISPAAPVASAPSVAISQAPAPTSKRRARAVATRLAIALAIGFVGGGLIAGIMEGNGHEEIEFGSDLANGLIFLCSLAAWFLLSLRSRRA